MSSILLVILVEFELILTFAYKLSFLSSLFKSELELALLINLLDSVLALFLILEVDNVCLSLVSKLCYYVD